jgi:periplasmic protein TonB
MARSNVIRYVRFAAETRLPDVVAPRDMVCPPPASAATERVRLALFVAISLALHGALFMAFWRDPVPLASIGLEVISVEIMVGAIAPAGIAATPGAPETQAAVAPETQQSEPVREAEQRATEQPQNIQVSREEAAPEQTTTLKPQPEERQQAEPRETPPDTAEISLLPQPEEKPAEPKNEAKSQAPPPKPIKSAAPAPERRRVEAPTKDHAAKQARASTPSTAANNVGVGRSDRDTNYPGLVSAHLRRHQQYPSDARGRGDQGTAAVTFSLDGSGRVTSARLARASGIVSIDQEVQAMVRRASPFPAPPSGRGVSFTVPVSFRLN